jgi:glycosyl transferase family 25
MNKQYNPPIFIINLERATTRRERMIKRLSVFGIKPLIFKATDGRALKEDELQVLADKEAIKKRYNRMLSKGEIACSDSHRRVYSEIVKHHIPWAVILEDDTVPEPDFYKIVQIITKLNIKKCVIKIDSHASKDTVSTIRHRKKINGKYSIRKPVFPQWDARGYMIDLLAARALLCAYQKISLLADDWGAMRRFVKIRYIVPSLVGDDLDSPSQLEEERSGKSNGVIKEVSIVKKIINHILFLIDKYVRIIFS